MITKKIQAIQRTNRLKISSVNLLPKIPCYTYTGKNVPVVWALLPRMILSIIRGIFMVINRKDRSRPVPTNPSPLQGEVG